MVITSKKLQENLGISTRVADFFANERPVPADNLFWENKRIYISAGFGFLTIPLIYDLVFKLGVSENDLLSDEHVSLMEFGFDKFMQYEHGLLSFPAFIGEMHNLMKNKIKQTNLADDLFALFMGEKPKHFEFETKHKALARSDSFLFTLVDLDVTDAWVKEFLPYWYAIARPILLLDDFKDLLTDRMKNEENTIIELGNDEKAMKVAYEMGIQDLKRLETINPKLSKYMMNLLKESLLYDYIQVDLD